MEPQAQGPVHINGEPTFAGAIRKLLSNPWIGGFGAIASIIGIPVTFWLARAERPEISYFVQPVRSVLVQAGHPSDLAVSYKGETVVTSVTSATVVIWNDGKKPVSSGEVLEPLKLAIDSGKRILEAKITKPSRNLVQFALDESKLASGEVGIRFRIVERNDGATIQVIYAGDSDEQLSLNGAVIGQPAIRRINARPDSDDFKQRSRWSVIGDWVVSSSFSVMLLPAMFVYWRRRHIMLRRRVLFVLFGSGVGIVSMYLCAERHISVLPPFAR